MPEIININEVVYDSCFKYDYTENVTFRNGTDDPQDSTLKTEYLLGEGTEFFIYRLRAFSISDTIKITLTSENLNEDIGLDWWTVGNNEIDQTSTLPFTYSTDASGSGTYLYRTISLRKFNISEGDKINIEIIPGDGQTNWVLDMGCANNLNCGEICTMSDNFKLDLDKIKLTPDYNGPNTVRFEYNKPCINTKVNGLYFGLEEFASTAANLRGEICAVPRYGTNNSGRCRQTQEPYTFKKVGDVLTFEFNSIEDLESYSDSYRIEIENLGYPYSNDPSDRSYYGYLQLRYNRSESSLGCESDLNDWTFMYVNPKCDTDIDRTNITFKIFLTTYDKPSGLEDCHDSIDFINGLLSGVVGIGLSDFEYDYTIGRTISVNPFNSFGQMSILPGDVDGFINKQFRLTNPSNETRPFKLNQLGPEITPNLPQYNDRVIDSDEIFIQEQPQTKQTTHYIYFFRVLFEENLEDYTISTKVTTNSGQDNGSYLDIYRFFGGVGTVLEPDYVNE